MRKVSEKQAIKNRVVASIKSELLNIDESCRICRRQKPLQAARILCKGAYPQFYLCDWNITLFCHDCHQQFDDKIEFRQLQIHLFSQVFEHAPMEAKKYFRFND